MFQDEARFGRMVRIKRCWAEKPHRPVVRNGYEREFLYVYGAVSPLQGQLDWMIAPKMNTEYMNQFLAQVSNKHRRDFIVMVVDGASSHAAKDLVGSCQGSCRREGVNQAALSSGFGSFVACESGLR